MNLLGVIPEAAQPLPGTQAAELVRAKAVGELASGSRIDLTAVRDDG